MWWRDHRAVARAARFAAVRLGVIVGAASLLAGCFEPLYSSHPSVGGESIKDKLAEVQIAPIPTRQGTPQARLAVGVHNALQFDLNGGAGANAPTHRLDLTVTQGGFTVLVDPSSGRPTAQVAGVQVSYQLVEIATGKIVLQDFDLRQCRLRLARPGAAFRHPARAARRRGPRRADGRRYDPQQAGVVFRRRDLEHDPEKWPPVFGKDHASNRITFMVAVKAADVDAFVARPDPARPVVLVFGPDAGLGQRTRQRHRQSLGRRRERSVRAGAPRRRGGCRRADAACRRGADHAAVRRPPRGVAQGRKPQYRARGRGGPGLAGRRMPRRHRGRRFAPQCAAARAVRARQERRGAAVLCRQRARPGAADRRRDARRRA